ncbi:single-stranded-DNA-specific exonuclease RecJ [Ruficoccus amylovorans]|uniref:Single-stranded-DNA-specific exonuclease RecJ n=1 Tax=Ruficoccus amylovorans TaxID=1804625 RepID=A0A842HKQ0_9BACT|nr:single-stranded-DNA-specific exonuclease RecJ [Ruficoccus amylovorans]MBC2596106.1 single-stranded-DNA-specific exonuclease RecJ [Ruficoccus amylovorans]
MRWSFTPPPESAVRLLRSEHGVDGVLAALLAARLERTGPSAAFLDPRLRHLRDPEELSFISEAVERLLVAIREGEDILVIGDYDVDGMTSTALLVSMLRHFGADPVYRVPRRLEEGYGLSESMLDRVLTGTPPDLLVALDCGTNSVAEVARLRARGIDVIIVDHHESKEAVPADCLLVNPKLYPGPGDEAARELCTAGLVFKLVHALVKRLRQLNDPRAFDLKLKYSLDLVALGTISDLVPLRGENRIFAREGLQQLASGRRTGLSALLEVSGLVKEHPICAADVAYRLGPRLNAGGRLADAALPVEMLLSESRGRAVAAATELDALNRERQAIERDVFDAAVADFSEENIPAGLVAAGADWHPGVVGIVAGRLARRFYRPAIVLSQDGDLLRGSGRSIPEVDLQEILHGCDGLLEEWGGHRMAVGITLAKDRLPEFRAAFNEAVGKLFSEAPPEPSLTIDAWIKPGDLGERLLGELDRLRPYGQENPEPVLGLKGAVLSRRPEVFAQKHLRFELTGGNGRQIKGIAWNGATNPPPTGQPIDLAVRFTWNVWNGHRSPRLELVDWRRVTPAGAV